MAEKQAIVYWLHNDDCVDPAFDGYVGVTQTPKRREWSHRRSARFPDNFKMTALFEGDENQCYSFENKLRPDPFIGWNIAPGGNKPPPFRGHSEKTKEKLRLKLKGNKNGLGNSGPRGNKWWIGRKHKDETLVRLRESHLGQTVSEETRQKISMSSKGRVASQETRDKISKSLTGKPLSDDHKHKISVAHKGKKRPDISARMTGRFWCNNGSLEKLVLTLPDNTWNKGRLHG